MIDIEKVLSCALGDNDADAATVQDYLLTLLAKLWEHEAGFNAKRPFGNSDWQYDIYKALIVAGLINGKLDEDGYVVDVDTTAADIIIIAAIQSLGRN